MKKLFLLGLLACAFAGNPEQAEAKSANVLNFQGTIKDAQEQVVNRSMKMTFKIYDTQTGGTALWTEDNQVTVKDGFFNVYLGTLQDLELNFAKELYIEVTLDNGDVLPRTRLTASPFAINAGTASEADTANVAKSVVDGVLTWSNFKADALKVDGLIKGTFPNNLTIDWDNVEKFSIPSDRIAGGPMLHVTATPGGKAGGDMTGTFPNPRLKNEVVENRHIAPNAVTTDKIKDGEVMNADLAENAVTTDKIKNGEVMTDDIADKNVTLPKLAVGEANQVMVTDAAGKEAAWSNDLALPGNLTVNGTTTLEGKLTAKAGADVTGDATFANNVTVTGKTTTGTLKAGATELEATTMASAEVAGLTKTNTLEAGATTTGTLNATENATFDKDVTVTGKTTTGTLKAGATELEATTMASADVTGDFAAKGNSVLGTDNTNTITVKGRLAPAAGGTVTANALDGVVVNTANIADGAVTNAKIADATINIAKLAKAAGEGADAGKVLVLDVNGKPTYDNLANGLNKAEPATTMGQVHYWDGAKWAVSKNIAPTDGQVLKYNETAGSLVWSEDAEIALPYEKDFTNFDKAAADKASDAIKIVKHNTDQYTGSVMNLELQKAGGAPAVKIKSQADLAHTNGALSVEATSTTDVTAKSTAMKVSNKADIKASEGTSAAMFDNYVKLDVGGKVHKGIDVVSKVDGTSGTAVGVSATATGGAKQVAVFATDDATLNPDKTAVVLAKGAGKDVLVVEGVGAADQNYVATFKASEGNRSVLIEGGDWNKNLKGKDADGLDVDNAALVVRATPNGAIPANVNTAITTPGDPFNGAEGKTAIKTYGDIWANSAIGGTTIVGRKQVVVGTETGKIVVLTPPASPTAPATFDRDIQAPNVKATANVEATEEIKAGTNITAEGNANVKGNTTLGTDASSTLTVNATSTFGAPATFNAGVTVDAVTTGALTVNNSAVIGDGELTDKLTVNAASEFQKAVTAKEDVTFEKDVTLNSGVAGTKANLNLTEGDVALTKGNVTVAAGNVAVTAGNVAVTTGNVAVGTGDVTVEDGNIKVGTAGTETFTVDKDGNTVVKGTLDVAGNATFKGALTAKEAATFEKDVTLNSGAAGTKANLNLTEGDVALTKGNVAVTTGNVTVEDGNIKVGTAGTETFTVDKDGNTVVKGTLNAGATTLASATVTGATNLAGLTAGATTLASATVTGATNLADLTAGATTLASAEVTGLTKTATLEVTGTTSFKDNVTVEAGKTVTAPGGFVGNLTGNAATATLADKATHLAGGAANKIPYQTGDGATEFLDAPAAGSDRVLLYNQATSKIEWAVAPTALSGDAMINAINDPAVTGKINTNRLADAVVLETEPPTVIKDIKGNFSAGLEIEDGKVTTAKIDANAVTEAKIATGAVTSAKIADESIVSGDIFNGTIQGVDLADGAVTPAKIANGTSNQVLVTNAAGTAVEWATKVNAAATADVATRAGHVEGGAAKQLVYQSNTNTTGFITAPSAANDVLTYDGATFAWVAKVNAAATADVATTANAVAADAILTGMIKDGEVQTNDIKDGSVTLTKIAKGTSSHVLVTNAGGTAVEWAEKVEKAKLADKASTVEANAIDAAALAANAVTSAKIFDGTITADDLGTASVATDELADGAVTSAKIFDGTIISADIANDAVTSNKLATDAVTSAKIADGTITVADLANDAVTSIKLATNAVTTAKIVDKNVAAAKILGGTVGQVLVSGASNEASWSTELTGLTNLTATGAVNLGAATTNTAIVGTASVGKKLTVASDGADITGNVTINSGNFFVGNSMTGLSIEHANGNLTTSGTLRAKGEVNLGEDAGTVNLSKSSSTTTVKGALTVAEATTLKNKLAAEGNVTVGKNGTAANLEVNDGTISLKNAGADKFTVSATGAVEAKGNVKAPTFEGNLTGNATTATTANGVVAGAVTAAGLAAGAVSGGNGGVITDASISKDDLGTASVESDELATDAVIEAKIKNGAVTTAKIKAGANNTVLVTNGTGVVEWKAATGGLLPAPSYPYNEVTDKTTLATEASAVINYKDVDLADNIFTSADLNPTAANGTVVVIINSLTGNLTFDAEVIPTGKSITVVKNGTTWTIINKTY